MHKPAHKTGNMDGSVIVCSAPGRASIIGNPTDMYGGKVLSCAVNERAHCELVQSDELTIIMGDDRITVRHPGDLLLKRDKFDIAKAALFALEIDPEVNRFQVHLSTDVPEQAGLAGSTAMLTSMIGVLLIYLGLDLNRYEVAEMVKRIEYKNMNLTCGYQDQYMAAFGGLNFMDFAGKSSMEQLPDEPFATIEPLGEHVHELPMILAHTGVMRNSGTVHKSLRERWLEGEKAVVNGYERISELAQLGKKAMILQDWQEMGILMNENHAIQRDLGGSGESNEILIKAALANGALGAKLSGAGGGGTIIALTHDIEGATRGLLKAGAERVFGLGPSSKGMIAEKRPI